MTTRKPRQITSAIMLVVVLAMSLTTFGYPLAGAASSPDNLDGTVVEAGNNTGDHNELPVGAPDESPDQIATNYQFLRAFGLPSEGIEMQQPYYAATGPNGDVYVVDLVARGILKFNAAGVLLTTWGGYGSGDGQFKLPGGIAVDGDGNVYVADPSNSRIQKFDSNGSFILDWENHDSEDRWVTGPDHVAVAPDGTIITIVTVNPDAGFYYYEIQRFDSNGVFLGKWDAPRGSGNGELWHPSGIDVGPGGLIYIANAESDRVQIFDSTGAWQGGFGERGAGDGQLDRPMSIAVAGNGTAYVADENNSRVQIFTVIPVLAPVAGVPGVINYQYAGTVNGSLSRPTGVALDGSGRLIVVDRHRKHVEVFASSGFALGGPLARVNVWSDDTRGRFSSSNPSGIELGPDGRVYAVDHDQARIKVFSAEGALVDEWGPVLRIESGLRILITLDGPRDLAFDQDGYIYVTDQETNRVLKLTSDGAFVSQFGQSGNGDGQFNNPHGIAVDDQGNIYVADAGNQRVQKFAPDFSFVASIIGTRDEPFDTPIGVAIDGDRVYVTDSGNAGKVCVFDPDGNSIADWDGFHLPAGITTDDDGFVYVGDFNGPIQKFSPDGELIATIGRLGTDDGEIQLNTAGPGLALDPAGNVYVGDPGNGRIQVFQPVS